MNTPSRACEPPEVRRIICIAVVALASMSARAALPADLVLLHARITTSAKQGDKEALAVAQGHILYVGDDRHVLRLAGPHTIVVDAHGRRVLPGMIDAHIHPTAGLYPLPICDLGNRAHTLAEIGQIVRGCLAWFAVKPGAWLSVAQWNYADGNQPDDANGTIRAALDRASPDNPVQLMGSDYHHGAYNSAALALARDEGNRVTGYSRTTLQGTFAPLAKLIGVDATGEPNGTVNEDARDRMGAPGQSGLPFAAGAPDPQATMRVLARDGITAIQDAAATAETADFYAGLERSGGLTVRVNLAQLYQPEVFRRADGGINYPAIVARADPIRARFAGDPLIRADAIKIFADGVLEGDPRADPPTLPESGSLAPFLQPRFRQSRDGNLSVDGYVDTASASCGEVRAHPAAYQVAGAVDTYRRHNGFHPAQCSVSSGKLQHDPQVIMDYARAMHVAGYTLHIHAVGDAAARIAVDSIEAARRADGKADRPDTIAHLQLVSSEDIARIGRDHLFTIYTFAWAYTDPAYDLTVIPFVQRVKGTGPAAFHQPGSYYETHAYPARSTARAGAITVAGSDAPVDARDPRPFMNLSMALTRAEPGQPALGPQERLTAAEAIAAYTINAARALGRDGEIGSLEPGKSADFILLDRDIVGLAAAGRAADIADTRVLGTWFRGRQVYAAGEGAVTP